MTTEQEEHVLSISDKFHHKLIDKYERGTKEHGGNLWEKAGIIDMALEEAIDLVVYLFTLKQQLESGELGFKKDVA